jgi:energy-converting hydrogenase Eha subunit A
MKANLLAETTLGKWSAGLNIFFLLAMTVSIILALGLKVLNFNDHWWDVTVAITFPLEIIALGLGIVAVRKMKERSRLVYLSIFIGTCLILFIFTHSLFIQD